jgi:hypothetical protein
MAQGREGGERLETENFSLPPCACSFISILPDSLPLDLAVNPCLDNRLFKDSKCQLERTAQSSARPSRRCTKTRNPQVRLFGRSPFRMRLFLSPDPRQNPLDFSVHRQPPGFAARSPALSQSPISVTLDIPETRLLYCTAPPDQSSSFHFRNCVANLHTGSFSSPKPRLRVPPGNPRRSQPGFNRPRQPRDTSHIYPSFQE